MDNIYEENNFDGEKPYNIKELQALCAFILVKHNFHINMHVLQSGLQAVSILTSYKQEMIKIGCGSKKDLLPKNIAVDLRNLFDFYLDFLECGGEC